MKKRILIFILILCTILSTGNALTITVSAEPNISIGQYVQMGTYYGVPILWRCVDVDENGPLMLSDRIICIKPFDAKGSNSSGSHGRGHTDHLKKGYYRQTYGSNYWADSNMRCWLNSNENAGAVVWSCGNPPDEAHVLEGYNEYADEAGFLTNFTDLEISAMKTVSQRSALSGYEKANLLSSLFNVINSSYHIYATDITDVVQNYDTSYSELVEDKVFLLDVKQINKVYQNDSLLGGNNYYIGIPTQECVSNCEIKDSRLNSTSRFYSWLRTPDADDKNGASVRRCDADGTIHSNGAFSGDVGVRPAFYLDLSSVSFSSGTGMESDPYKIGATNENRTLIDTMLKTPSTVYNNDLALIAASLAFKTYDDGMRDDTSVKNCLHYDYGFELDDIKSYSAVADFVWADYVKYSPIFHTVDGYGDYFSFTTATKDYGDTAVLVIIAQGTSEIFNDEGIYDKLTGTTEINGYTVFDVVRDFYENIYNNFDSVVDGRKKYKVLLTGHSLGGATVNWTAEQIMDGYNKKVSVVNPKEDVYCYTFGAINSIRSSSLVEDGYENIHNVFNTFDELFSGNFYGSLANIGNGMFEKNGKFGVLEMFRYNYASQEAKNNPDVKQGEPTPNHSNYWEAVKAGRIIRIFVDGKKLKFNDVPPFIHEGRVLVPIRPIAEGLNADVNWDGLNNVVTITKENKIIKITIGDNKIHISDNSLIKSPSLSIESKPKEDVVEIDVPAEIVDNRTFIPLRAASEALGCKVEWNSDTRSVLISQNQ